MNEGSPGVSIRLTLTSRHWKEASDAEIDIPRAFSSSSASETVVPSVTLPRRVSRPRLEQERLVQRRLAAATVAD